MQILNVVKEGVLSDWITFLAEPKGVARERDSVGSRGKCTTDREDRGVRESPIQSDVARSGSKSIVNDSTFTQCSSAKGIGYWMENEFRRSRNAVAR